MSKILIICEKPDQAKKYADAMKIYGSFSRKNGYLESDKYIFTYAFGHLLNSKGPKEYKEFGGWKWEAIPFFPPKGSLDYHVKEQSKKQQVNIIGQLLKRDDVDSVINGADAGREGDLIFWEIYDYFKCKKPVERLLCSTYVHEDVQKAFKNLKDDSFFIPRRAAAYSRQYADWALGMNLTVGFSIKANMGRALHVGRVQTPTIALLVNRKREIENFKPEDYFEIEAEFGQKYKGKWFKDQLGNTKFDKKEDAQLIINKINGKLGTVVKKNVKEEKQHPKKLYNLNDLQREADTKFGFDPTKTLNIAQLLYEKYAVLSYPRTDSRYLSTTQVPELKQYLDAVSSITNYKKFVDYIVTSGIKTSKMFVNDKEVTDHHAIIPTKETPNTSAFTDEPKDGIRKEDIVKVYDLVVKRFLAVFYPPAIYEKTEVVTEVEEETFKTSGKILVDAGWKEIYGSDDDDEDEEETPKKGKKQEEKVKVQKLPPIDKGETNNVTDSELQEKQTKPPSHYTNASLLGIMEDPRKLLDDDGLKEAMKEAKAGLGTGATRAGIIDNIVNRGYIEKKGKSLIATDLAEKLIDIAPNELKSPEVTADWEQKLLDMEKSALEEEDFKMDIRNYVEKNLIELKNTKLEVDFGHVNEGETVGKCPTCQTDVKEKMKAFSCDSDDCFVVFKTMANKKISTAQVKLLLSKGETNELKGFKSKAGKKFDAKLVIKDGKVTFGFPEKKNEKTDLDCPNCSGKMIDKGMLIVCENSTQEKKCVTIFKTIAKKTLTDKQIEQLVIKGETDSLSGFKSKKGKNFSAKLKLNGVKIDFEFDKPSETGIKCPFCGGNVNENPKAYGCSNWKEKNCKFTIWKTMMGKKMNEKIVKELIDKKETEKLDGFKSSKTGKAFSAKLVLNMEKKKIDLSFE